MRHLILAGLLLVTPAPLLAQFRIPLPRVPGLPTEVPVPPVPGLDQLLREEPPVSTSLQDAIEEIPLLDDYTPKQYAPMTRLSRGENGTFRVTPGVYQFDAQSYCLHAGTHGPGGGDGYLYAPLKGRRDAIIRRILQRSVNSPQIPQQQIQLLIWSILARTRINDLSPDLQAVARQLLTQEDINRLNGGALGQIPPEVRSRMFASLPPAVRQVLNAEAEMRSLLSQGNASYAQLEQIAVLAGNATRGEGSRDVPTGRWSYHPSGFFIRYIPSGYSRTRIQISLPDRYTISRDSLGRITAIADQRGDRIETTYDDTIAPRPHDRNPNLRAYAFRNIRFIRPNPANPRGPAQQYDLPNTGWVFVHTPVATSQFPPSTLLTHKSLPQPATANQQPSTSNLSLLPPSSFLLSQTRSRFWDWAQRGQEAYDRQQQIEDYWERLERQRRDRSQRDVDDLTDLGHYRDGVEAAVGGSPAERIDWIADHQQRTANALEYAICILEERCQAGGTADYDPSGDVAVPGNTSRQRLGQSARAY